LKNSKERVLKISEKLIPQNYYNDLKKTGFDDVYKYSVRAKMPKEDLQNFEV